MSHFVVFEYYSPNEGKGDELIKALESILQHSRANLYTIPCVYILKETAKEGEASQILTISNFNNEASYKGLLETSQHKQLQHALQTNNLLTISPRTEILTLSTGFLFRATPPPTLASFVVTARILYNPGTISQGVRHWSKVTSAVERDEDFTAGYCFLRSDGEDADVLRSLEIYSDEEKFKKVHVPSEAIQGNIATQKGIRIEGGLSWRFWEEVGCSRRL